jgi:hypothetical protein
MATNSLILQIVNGDKEPAGPREIKRVKKTLTKVTLGLHFTRVTFHMGFKLSAFPPRQPRSSHQRTSILPTRDSTIADRFTHFRICVSVILSFGLVANCAITPWTFPNTILETSKLLLGHFLAVMILCLLSNRSDVHWIKNPMVRRLIGDELTSENRRNAQVFAFRGFLFLAAVLLILNLFRPEFTGAISASKVVQMTAAIAIGLAGVRFGYLEQKSLARG